MAEPTDLRDLNASYWIAASTARQARDQNIAAWQRKATESRDHIHDYLNQIGLGDPKELRKAVEKLEESIEAMDEYLRRSKHDGVW